MEKVKLFRVLVQELTEEQHFPIDYNHDDKYFEWSNSLDKKINEYNTIEITEVGFYEAEKMLIFCEVKKEVYSLYLEDNDCDTIDYEIDFDWIELKSEIIKNKRNEKYPIF